jgi:biopolymer transport protein ExbD
MSTEKATNQDFELNLASIIDCLTVLITFLLASASFLSIGILDAGLAAGSAHSAGGTPPPVTVTVELKAAHKMEIKIGGKENRTISIGEQDGEWDYKALTRDLSTLKTRWNGLNALTLSAENGIEYREIVRTMEVARKILPAVMLGGF